MKKLIYFCILFVTYINENYIAENWSIYKPYVKIILYPIWFIRSILIWLVCPIFLPEYLFKRSRMYKQFKKLINSKLF